jgi:hypothetical protein
LLEFWERIDKRASHYRELLRGRRAMKDVSRMSIDEYLEAARSAQR